MIHSFISPPPQTHPLWVVRPLPLAADRACSAPQRTQRYYTWCVRGSQGEHRLQTSLRMRAGCASSWPETFAFLQTVPINCIHSCSLFVCVRVRVSQFVCGFIWDASIALVDRGRVFPLTDAENTSVSGVFVGSNLGLYIVCCVNTRPVVEVCVCVCVVCVSQAAAASLKQHHRRSWRNICYCPSVSE